MYSETFLDWTAGKHPSFVLFGDRIFVNGDPDSQSSEDQMIFDGMTLPMFASLPFHHLESLDFHCQRKYVKAFKEDYVRRSLSEGAREHAAHAEERMATLRFIIDELLPEIMARDYDDPDEGMFTAMRGEEEGGLTAVDKAKAALKEHLEARFGGEDLEEIDLNEQIRAQLLGKVRSDINDEGSSIEKKYSLEEMGLKEDEIVPSVLGKKTAHQPLYFAGSEGGRIFVLEQVDEESVPSLSKEHILFKLNGKYYLVPDETHEDDIDDFTSNYSTRRSNRLKEEALESLKEKAVDIERLAENKIDSKILQHMFLLHEFDFNGYGFVYAKKKDGSWGRNSHPNFFVYKRLHAFATQDARDGERYWEYPSMRIGIKVWYNNRSVYIRHH